MTTTPHSMPTTLMTPRLRLRAPVTADSSRIAMFIGDWDVAKMLSRVPYPYTEQDAKHWIADPGQGEHFAVVHANGVIGTVGLDVRDGSGALELGYWLAKPFWGRGFMTEAASAVIKALRACDESAAVTCSHFEDNAASAAVIRKLGFRPQGERQIDSVSRGQSVRSLTYRLPAGAPDTKPSLEPELETAGGVR